MIEPATKPAARIAATRADITDLLAVLQQMDEPLAAVEVGPAPVPEGYVRIRALATLVDRDRLNHIVHRGDVYDFAEDAANDFIKRKAAHAECTLGWMDPSRTANIELIAALFCSMPLTAENVFLRPARLDGRHGERELCDVLVALRGHGIVLSLKSQDATTPREGPMLRRWCAKHARKAAGQISGACRAMKMQSFWCQHRRRGRVDFAAGAITPVHALAIIETGPLPTDTTRLPDDLSDSAGDTTITYVTLNDALNLVDQLRSVPDLVAYLHERATLPMWCRRMIGNERCLVQYYMLNRDSFDGSRPRSRRPRPRNSGATS